MSTFAAGKFWQTVESAAGKPLGLRVKVWPDALTQLRGLMVANFREIQTRPDLHGRLARFDKLANVVKGAMSETEREAVYLAALQAGESVLAPFGFPVGMERLRADLSAHEAERRTVSKTEVDELQMMLAKLASMLPWRNVVIIVDSNLADEEEMNTYWDGKKRILTFCLEHARIVRKNLSEYGIYTTLVGQVLAPMLSGPHPITDTFAALVLTAELGKKLGAVDPPLKLVQNRREPPDIYRGEAARILAALWNQPRTQAELSELAPNTNVTRVLRMLAADGPSNKWRLVSSGSFHSVIVA